MAGELERLRVESRAAWREWLQAHHATSPGVWLVTYKRAHGDRYVAYDDVVEEALCFGWVDNTTKRVDDDRTSTRCVPRRARSSWSASNRARIERLEVAGRLAPAGRAAVEAAKAGGTWA